MAIHFIKANNHSKDSNRFHISIAPVLALPQVFCLLPITGIFSKNANDIKFKLTSLRTLGTIFWFINAIVYLYLAFKNELMEEHMSSKSLSIKMININRKFHPLWIVSIPDVILYYSMGFLSAVLLVPIAYKWNKLVQLFKGVDDIFCNNPYSLAGWSLKIRIRIYTFAFVVLATLEHSLFWYSFLHDRFIQAEACNWAIKSWIIYVVSYQLDFVFELFPASEFSAIWAEYMNISFTFVWSYVDFLIMAICISITSKFRMFNQRLEYYKGTIVTKEFWAETRLHYNKVCELNDYVCDLLGNSICCACLYDLYCVCVTVYNIASFSPNSYNMIYFMYSTTYIMCRTFTMYLISSSIYDESIKSLKVLRTIPSNGWIPEVKRLYDQIHHSNLALSGKNFFFLTRGITISIIGIIITYELVLFQFEAGSYYSDESDDCRFMGHPLSIQNSTLTNS